MNNIKNRIIDFSSVGFTDMIGAGTVAFFWFYIASELGPENYGELTFIISIASLASGFALFGSNHTIWIMSAKKIDIEKTIFVLVSITTMISVLIIFIIFLNVGLVSIIFSYVLLSLVIPGLLGRKFYKTYAKYLITQKILMVTFGLGFYYLFGEFGILIGISLSYVHLIFPLVKTVKKSKINFNLIKEKKEFIFNNIALSISRTLYSSLDKLIIAPLLGYAILGNYSLGLQFFQILSLLPNTSVKYFIAQDATGIKNKKFKKLIIIASIGIAILGTTIAPSVISHIFPKFIEAQLVIQIISWAVIPMSIQATHYMPKLWAQERNRIILYHAIVMVLVQTTSILSLGYLYEATGVAIAFVISSIVGCGFIALMDKITNKN
jgi:O-antigen/teichoic acid export membrane protein